MAEVFGIVAGALSVAALFNNCVDCFEYIQLGRHFGRDYERCQLKLKIAQTRLSRWGKAVDINQDPRFATISPADASTLQVQSVLEEIGLLFQSVAKASKRYELSAKQEDLILYQDTDIRPVFQRVFGRLETVVRQRQKETSLMKKAAWALYDGKNFDKLVEQITGFIDDLENICPIESACRQLAQLEIAEVDDEPSLKAISDGATDIDLVLAEAAGQKAEGIAMKIHVGTIGTQDTARVRVGNEYDENVLGRGLVVTDQTITSVDIIDAKGSSAVHIGNTYGGRGIFDD
jgi:hypothetical protein